MKSEDTYELIGKRIKEIRDNAHMSQKELADALGYESATAVSLIESGNRKVEVETLEKIAKILHVDIKFLLGHKEETVPSFNYALRADKELTPKDKELILKFIDLVKKQK